MKGFGQIRFIVHVTWSAADGDDSSLCSSSIGVAKFK